MFKGAGWGRLYTRAQGQVHGRIPDNPFMLQYQTIPVTPFQQNCSLIWDDQTRQAAVVDPGGDLDLILGAVKALGLQLEQIWITHGHVDHASGTADLAEQLGGLPIIVSSGYRSLALNRAIGSKDTSQHVTGEAADFVAPSYGPPRVVMDRIVDAGIDYDQCILEFASRGGWVHISFSKQRRRQALIIDETGTRPFFA